MENICGVFTQTEDAVMASKAAYERYSSFSLKERGELITGLREKILIHAENLAAMEKEETGMGVYQDKLCQIVEAIMRTPGASFITQDAVSDEEGLLLDESFPFGVSCAIHPVNHPVASIINHTIMLLSAGNSVIHLLPRRAANVCSTLVRMMNQIVLEICGIDNLVICMAEGRHEYNKPVLSHPDVSLVVATGGNHIVGRALGAKKRVIAAGSANPVVIVDQSADIRYAARCIADDVSFDNNLLCSSEKNVVVLHQAHEEFIKELKNSGAFFLNGYEEKKLEQAVFDEEGSIRKEFIGQDASSILVKAGILPAYQDRIRLIIFDAEISSPFVVQEVAAPILPIVEVDNFYEAIEAAKFIEQGYGHTAGIFSKDIDHLSKASRELQTAIFVKNGPTLSGPGIKGTATVAFTIANMTGEGAVTPKCFVKRRRCILAGSFERR